MKAILAAFFMVLLSSFAYASLEEYNIDVSINDDGSTDWLVKLDYTNITTKSDYFIFGTPANLEVTADGSPIKCSATSNVGVSIICNNVNSKSVVYKFRLENSIENIRDLRRFSYKFSITQFTDRFAASIKLPLGAALVETSRLSGTGLQPFEPSFGREGSDGRKIYIEWISNIPKLGETYDISIIYEDIQPINQQILPFFVIIAALLAIIGGFIVYNKKFRVSSKNILPVLAENERKVMQILINEKKDVDQRKIIKDTDFSKPKVSRIIKELVGRGLVEKIPKGRTNIIRLKKRQK
ncbi:MAG: hypothetical protein HYT73_01195 [Candidatus Aenigmarchaeota archaeon]|nr:hypothetical protein [Candidatus Aenigmarchaeota archaeon]